MTSSQDMIRGRSNVVTLTNNSGGALVVGDVCVQDTTADEKATTTTSAASLLKVFIAAESIGIGAAGKFYSGGYCPLVTPSASTTRGRYLFTHTVAKQAAENATYGAGAFGVILTSGTTPTVWLFGSTAQGSGGVFSGTTGSTDNAVLRADGTGGTVIQSSLATINDTGTVNIPTGQTYNINNSPHTHAGAASYNKSATMWMDECIVAVGNALTRDINGAYPYNNLFYSASPAQNDRFDLSFVIAAGTYTLNVHYATAPAGGIATVTIDGGSSLGTIDTYAGGYSTALFATIAGIVLTDGQHKLSFTMATKNGSSSGYRFGSSKIWLVPASY